MDLDSISGFGFHPDSSLPPPSKDGYTPVVIQNPSGKNPDDVYIRIQGNAPDGKPCVIDFTKGVGSYFDIPPHTPGGSDFSQYCIKLSSLPKNPNGPGYLLYLPPLVSGRMFFSIDKPMNWYEPSVTNTSDPDNDIDWGMIEMTTVDNQPPVQGHPNGDWFDYSAVDDMGLPLELRMHTSDGKPDQVHGWYSDTETAQQFLQNAAKLLAKYDTTPNHIWSKLVQSGQGGHIYRILAAKDELALPNSSFPNDYFKSYLEGTFCPHFQNKTLTMDATAKDGKSIENYTGNTYEKDGKWYFRFVGDKDGNVVVVPANTDRAAGWFSGGMGSNEFGPIPPNTTPEAYKDLVRDLSAVVNAGVLPKAMDGQVITKDWMIAHKDDFYKAPVYNVYDRALHEAGLNAYAYDYDDRLGQDGTETGPFDGTSVTIVLPHL